MRAVRLVYRINDAVREHGEWRLADVHGRHRVERDVQLAVFVDVRQVPQRSERGGVVELGPEFVRAPLRRRLGVACNCGCLGPTSLTRLL